LSTPLADAAGEVRAGESLDMARLDPWLKQRIPRLAGVARVTQYAGGASNWTYRLQYDTHDLILRRPPAGTKAKSAHDMGREFRIQQALRPVFPLVPEMLAHCDDAGVIGAEFYVMQRLDGIIPRKHLPRGLKMTPAQARQLCTNMLDTLVALHRIDPDAAGLSQFGKGAGYARRQVEGWIARYGKARTWNVPRGTRITDWLRANVPADARSCFVHNDFRFDNLVLDAQDPTRIIGVLDWELATIGDPLMDLGNTIAYWVQADDDPVMRRLRRQPTDLPGMLTRREVVAYYCAQTGLDPSNWTFYEVQGLFRVSAIAQQIYFRYHHGQTRNPAFRHFWLFVHYLHWRCRRLIRRHARHHEAATA
jgi:aminoglycoside phosphotransferase (APT) family kinase protein